MSCHFSDWLKSALEPAHCLVPEVFVVVDFFSGNYIFHIYCYYIYIYIYIVWDQSDFLKKFLLLIKVHQKNTEKTVNL